LSPDPLGGNAANPQLLNRYSYGLNSPVNFYDPLGLTDCPQGKECGFFWGPGNPANGCALWDATCGGDLAFGARLLGAMSFGCAFNVWQRSGLENDFWYQECFF
jgi:hypothetical protein